MLNRLKKLFMGSKARQDYHKEEIRGTIKEIMKTRGLRSISLSNYNRWKERDTTGMWLHSVKINMEDGYLYMYDFNRSNRRQPGERYEKPTMAMYEEAYKQIREVLNNEDKMPFKIKRNILVKMNR
jgi:hypothetical protein